MIDIVKLDNFRFQFEHDNSIDFNSHQLCSAIMRFFKVIGKPILPLHIYFDNTQTNQCGCLIYHEGQSIILINLKQILKNKYFKNNKKSLFYLSNARKLRPSGRG